ncbi:MAG: rRNA maturation RNase YbeY, partial [Sulfuritalea sp.]|nr:rRNA maturation RNase YbeY [Sulfuritalea sp.]
MTPSVRRLPELRLSVQYPGGRGGAPPRPQVRRWVRAACTRPAEVTVRFVGSEEGRNLNRDYRRKDYATNVLSFPYE